MTRQAAIDRQAAIATDLRTKIAAQEALIAAETCDYYREPLERTLRHLQMELDIAVEPVDAPMTAAEIKAENRWMASYRVR